MCAWLDFYKGRLLDAGYLEYAAKRYAPYLDAIRSRILSGDRVVEIGCGLATMTRLLVDSKPPNAMVGFRCYDISQDMVGYARMNLPEGFPVEVGDARKPTGRLPDIVHSHGMLEHFSDDDIRSVIQASKDDGARVCVHYVPGAKYETPSFGDERLMTVAQWREISHPTDVVTFNNDFDYALIWKL